MIGELRRRCAGGLAALLAASNAFLFAETQIKDGAASFSAGDLEPGKILTLNGEWLYKPGYEVGPNDKPELVESSGGFLPVPVPQLLNRIY